MQTFLQICDENVIGCRIQFCLWDFWDVYFVNSLIYLSTDPEIVCLDVFDTRFVFCSGKSMVLCSHVDMVF